MKQVVEVAILCGIGLVTLRCGFLRIRRKMNQTAGQDDVRSDMFLMPTLGFFFLFLL